MMVKKTEAKIKRLFFKSKQIEWPSFFRDISNKMKKRTSKTSLKP